MNSSESEKPRKKFPVKPLIFAAIIVVLTCIANLPQVRDNISMEAVNAQLLIITEIAQRPYGPILYILVSILMIVLHMPGLVMVVVGPLVYDLWPAFAYNMIGSSIGTTATFLLSRYFLRDYFRPKMINSFVGQYVHKLESNGIMMMILLRLIMIMMPHINWLLGATNVRIRDFMIGNVLGLAPVILGIMIAVKKVKTIQSAGDILQPETIGLVLAFGAIVLFIAFVRKKWFEKSES